MLRPRLPAAAVLLCVAVAVAVDERWPEKGRGHDMTIADIWRMMHCCSVAVALRRPNAMVVFVLSVSNLTVQSTNKARSAGWLASS